MGAIVSVILGLAGRLGGATGAGALFFAGLAEARGILAEKLIPPPRASVMVLFSDASGCVSSCVSDGGSGLGCGASAFLVAGAGFGALAAIWPVCSVGAVCRAGFVPGWTGFAWGAIR